MNSDTPRSLDRLPTSGVMTTAQLRARGVSPAEANERCRAGGGWRQLLPGVYLLHPGPPTGEERVRGALLYATARGGIPAQHPGALITGEAALTLHGFTGTAPLDGLPRIDVLVPRLRRLRSVDYVRIIRTTSLPPAEQSAGVPVAPVARALADTVGDVRDAVVVRRLLTEAVRAGHCEPAAVVRELRLAQLLTRAQVVAAVDSLLAEGRAVAEGRLYAMVREFGLPDPVWNVDLRLSGGPYLGGLDAYWPDHAVAVELDTRTPRDVLEAGDPLWSEYARRRETLERLNITVVHLTPQKLRETPEQQAVVVRTALMASADRPPAARVVVLPR